MYAKNPPQPYYCCSADKTLSVCFWSKYMNESSLLSPCLEKHPLVKGVPMCFLRTITESLSQSNMPAKNFNLKKTPKHFKIWILKMVNYSRPFIYQRNLEDYSQTVKLTCSGSHAKTEDVGLYVFLTDFSQPWNKPSAPNKGLLTA